MLDGSKKLLISRVGDGSIIKRFEKTPLPKNQHDIVCPHFLELKWAYGCPFDCAWCYLKGTLRLLPTKTKPIIKNLRKVETHVKRFFECEWHPAEILNSGELADSLMGENLNPPFSKFIISLFEKQKKHKILFLTKSTNIQNLLSLDSHTQVIISFSLNAEKVAKKWENAPPVEKRIIAAKELYEHGYEIRVRIDPMVPINNWKKHYQNLIDKIFSNFIPSRITLGSLRGLQTTINEANDKSWTKFLNDYSNWGKKINFQVRFQMYKTLINYIQEKYEYRGTIGLCKETVGIWEKLNMDWRKCKCNCVW